VSSLSIVIKEFFLFLATDIDDKEKDEAEEVSK